MLTSCVSALYLPSCWTQSVSTQLMNASSSGIARWNRRLRERVRNGIVRSTVTAVLYPVTRGRARLIRLPIRNRIDHTVRPWCEDIEIGHWFPFGARLRRVDTIAGSTFSLVNDYTIFTSTFESGCPLNGTIRDQMGLFLRGNVLVVRHCSREQLCVCRVSRPEMRFVDLVVQRCEAYSSFTLGIER
ncbi:hypothetical protein C8Q76DRAFT_626864 [Earliella scabrosa]|nr:hypothetical protein C8Q76DRAFT_626864 [Earliella scabrosa]